MVNVTKKTVFDLYNEQNKPEKVAVENPNIVKRDEKEETEKEVKKEQATETKTETETETKKEQAIETPNENGGVENV